MHEPPTCNTSIETRGVSRVSLFLHSLSLSSYVQKSRAPHACTASRYRGSFRGNTTFSHFSKQRAILPQVEGAVVWTTCRPSSLALLRLQGWRYIEFGCVGSSCYSDSWRCPAISTSVSLISNNSQKKCRAQFVPFEDAITTGERDVRS